MAYTAFSCPLAKLIITRQPTVQFWSDIIILCGDDIHTLAKELSAKNALNGSHYTVMNVCQVCCIAVSVAQLNVGHEKRWANVIAIF